MERPEPPSQATSTGAVPWQRIAARHADLGGGFSIARVLPSGTRRTVGAWCFLDHAGPARFAAGAGMRVGPHPHMGLQTFTWMIEGQVLHHDTLGNRRLISPGEVNLMTAGRGIAHSEESVGDQGVVHAAQLWIALPDAQRHCEPAFVHHASMPVARVDGFRATVLAGSAFDLHSPVMLFSELIGVDFVAAAAAHTRVDLQRHHEHAVLCLRGVARIDGQAIEPAALHYAPPGRDRVELACDGFAQLLLIGGTPFDEALLIWWNFVARTQAEIEEAAADWNAGRRFGDVSGTTLARVPAPSTAGLRLKPR